MNRRFLFKNNLFEFVANKALRAVMSDAVPPTA